MNQALAHIAVVLEIYIENELSQAGRSRGYTVPAEALLHSSAITGSASLVQLVLYSSTTAAIALQLPLVLPAWFTSFSI